MLRVLWLFLLSMHALCEAKQRENLVLDEGGYQFHATYKLTLPTPESSPLELIVQAEAMRDTRVVSSYNGPISPALFELHLNCQLHAQSCSHCNSAVARQQTTGACQRDKHLACFKLACSPTRLFRPVWTSIGSQS